MEYFSVCFDGLCLAGQGVMHIVLAEYLTRKNQKMWHFAIYLTSLNVIESFSPVRFKCSFVT